MSILLAATLIYLAFALCVVVAVDNLVGLVFRDPRAPAGARLFSFGRSFAAPQKPHRK
jgi:hypothetical protein